MYKEKIIITYGTFDLFHIGHLKLLQRISKLGDRLIVAVSTDEFNQIKGKKTIIPFEQRAKIVESIRYVDRVIAENSWDQKRDDIKKYGVTHFVMGDDWRGKFDDLKELCEVIYLPRTKGISSSELKDTIKALSAIDLNELNHAIEILKRIKENLE